MKTNPYNCRSKIVGSEAQIRSGASGSENGLRLTQTDWSGQLRLRRAGQRLATVAPRLAQVRSRGDSSAFGPRLPVIGAVRPDIRARNRKARYGSAKRARKGAGRSMLLVDSVGAFAFVGLEGLDGVSGL